MLSTAAAVFSSSFNHGTHFTWTQTYQLINIKGEDLHGEKYDHINLTFQIKIRSYDSTFVIVNNLIFSACVCICVILTNFTAFCWFEPMLKTQWRNFARGCPWARDGWMPHWLRSACAECKKSKRATRASLTAWGPGVRLRAPVGSRGKAPGGGPEGEAPGSSCAFQCGYSISNANLYTSDC